MSNPGIPSSHHIMDKLMNDYKCSICLEIFVDATSTSCRHIFCRFCLTKWLQFSPKCPQCHNTVNSCTPTENIDLEVDTLFLQLPTSVCKDRDEVKQRRRKLETESFTNINNSSGTMQNKAILDKLRSQREKSSMKNEGLDKTLHVKGVERDEKFQLPRLVSNEKLNDRAGVKLKISNGNTNQYENVKLPPIKKGSTFQRQSRGILTTTSSVIPKTDDTFPIGMEGDIQGDASAEDNIRELERRNQILEEQLFGAYDRIMDAIKQSNTDVSNTMDPNIFRDSGGPLNQSTTTGQEPSFSKESMIANTAATAEENAIQKQKRSNDVEDLLAETEDLIEIEDFLKKFPFERIRDDETLINYDEDDEDDMSLDLLDSDLLKDIAEHRATKGSKPLTADQLAIENFYKKLEVRQQKQGTAKRATALPQAPRIPNSITQQTSASKMKRLPTLKKLDNSTLQLPTRMQSNNNLRTNSPTSNTNLQGNYASKLLSANERAPDRKATKNGAPSAMKLQYEKSSMTNKSSTTIMEQSSRTSLNSSKQQNLQPSSIQKVKRNFAGTRLSSDDLDPLPHLDPGAGLNYEDFLKLEIDFLDGDGDWKDFEKPPEPTPTTSNSGFKQPGGSSTSNPTANVQNGSTKLQPYVRTRTSGKQGHNKIKIMSQNPVGIPTKKIITDKSKKSETTVVEYNEMNTQVATKKK
ncbi:unnamed protein product [Allacma fusca]|uniref:RING-type domain-containing protein n=1 Tax=Allacma fusca TaxID=39272 RepID=A0A8J2JZI5_9HEXA|nr:unnamed protein product [Allacma fusca]